MAHHLESNLRTVFKLSLVNLVVFTDFMLNLKKKNFDKFNSIDWRNKKRRISST